MEVSTWWWIFTGLAVVAELLTGTIYLLMIGLGLAAGAVAAHLGLSLPVQIATAAVVGVLCVMVARRIRRARSKGLPALSDPAVNLDIGETITVAQWEADGTSRVPYRGAQWTAVLRPGAMPAPGQYRVVALQGNRLVVDKA
ncbi:NfeD family protein [Comamonas sp. GB3 AK4-5]|uniref:NfeD family protein n=1 Tax=Comamonas sp. GB3 AK4-5 TaxID=3231487 RepID=UPI00351E4406